MIVGDHKVSTPYVKELRAVDDPRIQLIGTVYDVPALTALRCHAFTYSRAQRRRDESVAAGGDGLREPDFGA